MLSLFESLSQLLSYTNGYWSRVKRRQQAIVLIFEEYKTLVHSKLLGKGKKKEKAAKYFLLISFLFFILHSSNKGKQAGLLDEFQLQALHIDFQDL